MENSLDKFSPNAIKIDCLHFSKPILKAKKIPVWFEVINNKPTPSLAICWNADTANKYLLMLILQRFY